LNHFFECIKDDEKPSTSPEEALRTLQIMEDEYGMAEKEMM